MTWIWRYLAKETMVTSFYRIEMLASLNDIVIVDYWGDSIHKTSVLDVLVLSLEMSVCALIGLFQV